MSAVDEALAAKFALTAIRVEDPALPYGYVRGFLTVGGLFIAQREGVGWLWDVWASTEAFTSCPRSAALVAGNLPSLAEAVTVAAEARDL